MNLEYFLENDVVTSKPVTEEIVRNARNEARKTPMRMRTCWNCNPAHARFLDDKTDNFFFVCGFGCGRYFYNGIDITEDEK